MCTPAKSPAEQKIFAFLHMLYAERQRFDGYGCMMKSGGQLQKEFVGMGNQFKLTREEADSLQLVSGPSQCLGCGEILGSRKDKASLVHDHWVRGWMCQVLDRSLVWNIVNNPQWIADALNIEFEEAEHYCVLWEQENKHLKAIS